MPKRAKVAVLISGSGTNMAALLYASKAQDCPYEIVLVTGDQPEAKGFSLAEAEGVPVIRFPKPTPKDKSQFFAALELAITNSGANYIALAGFMRIIPAEFVSNWAGRMVNIHPSLLPKYTGLHTHERALEAGDAFGGCTVHLVTADLDEGPILGQTPVTILPGDSTETLAARVLIAEHQLYSRCLASLVTRSTDPNWLLAQLRPLALALPEAEEAQSHGMASFGVTGGKKFAYFSSDHHGDGRIAVMVKTSGPDEQAMLIDRDEDRFFRPAYLGPAGWIAIRLDLGDTDWDDIGDWLQRSWRHVAPKRLTRLMDIADQF